MLEGYTGAIVVLCSRRGLTFQRATRLSQVRFSFSADEIGSANLTFTATDTAAGGASDGLQVELPVYGTRRRSTLSPGSRLALHVQLDSCR